MGRLVRLRGVDREWRERETKKKKKKKRGGEGMDIRETATIVVDDEERGTDLEVPLPSLLMGD